MRILLPNSSKIYRRKVELMHRDIDALLYGWLTMSEIEKRAVATLVNELTDSRTQKLFVEDKPCQHLI